MNDLISVVIPVYNAARYLDACLKSVVGQTYRKLDIIVVDDGSTDCSDTIINKYAKNDSRIHVISNTNHGVSFSRNCGIDHARGKYIAFIDSDDIVKDNYIERLLKPLVFSDISFTVCRYKSIDEDSNDTVGQIYGPDAIGDLSNDFYELTMLNGILYGPWAKLYKLDLINKHHIRFNEKLSNGEDQLFNFAYYRYIKQYCFVNEELYFYRNRKNSLSKSKTQKSLDDLYIARNALIKFLSNNQISHCDEIVAAHCMTDLIDYVSVDKDGYRGYKKRVKKVRMYLEKGLNAGLFKSSRKNVILRFLLHHSLIFPLYVLYKYKY